MKIRSMAGAWGVAWAGAILGIQAGVAGGSLKSPGLHSVLVRVRHPQNSQAQALRTAFDGTGQIPSQVGVVHESEGLIQLSFATEALAKAALQRLQSSKEVLSVSPNLFYRSTVQKHLSSAKEVAAAPELNSRALERTQANSPFRMLPFADTARLVATALPEVGLPSWALSEAPDPLLSQDWAWKQIHMPENEIINQNGIVVAVIDTGVDYNHEDLQGAMWRHPSNPQEVGYDFAHQHAKPFDVVHYDIEGCRKDPLCKFGLKKEPYLINAGHGTHCAGHVAAVARNGLGIQGVGAAAQVRIMGLKFFNDPGEPNEGQGDDAAAIQAIDYAIRNGARVISASWGDAFERATAESSEMKKALIRAQKAGLLVVVAAGNSGEDQDTSDTPMYPAAYDLDNLIVVAASDANENIASFSNYGARSVHLAAPGVKILSTTVGSRYSDWIAQFNDDQGKLQQIDWDGTSMATPLVAGAVALVWSKYPQESYHEIRDRILRSVRKVPGLQGKVATGGILDVAAALGN